METILRKEAITLGLKRYYTGQQCKNGHVSERYTQSRNCVGCVNNNDYNKERYHNDEEYRKKRIAAVRKWAIANPDRVKINNKKQQLKNKERYHNDPKYRQKICDDNLKRYHEKKKNKIGSNDK